MSLQLPILDFAGSGLGLDVVADIADRAAAEAVEGVAYALILGVAAGRA